MSMSATTYSEFCERIYGNFLQKLELRDDAQRRFAPKGIVAAVLHDDTLKEFFEVVFSSLPQNFTPAAIYEFVERVHRRELHAFLATILFARCRVTVARIFIDELVLAPRSRFLDASGTAASLLPATRGVLRELLADDNAIDQVLQTQACFCTVNLYEREEFTYDNMTHRRWPYTEEVPLDNGEGAFGKVWKVKVATGHFIDRARQTSNIVTREMARKDYLASDSSKLSHGKHEYDNLKKILSGRILPRNIAENLGCLQVGTQTFSLFMPLAFADLRVFMMNKFPEPPARAEAREIIGCAAGLAQALDFLHTKIDNRNSVCYHLDLKPNNVLVFLDGTLPSGQTRYIWKLSDFGMSRVKERQVFRRRRPQDPSFELTRLQRGQGTYQAPESQSLERKMGTKSDVWSLGCILSVVFTYLEGGRPGVVAYEGKRREHPRAQQNSFFYLASQFSGRRFPNKDIHPAIAEQHQTLIDAAMKRSDDEGKAVRDVLTCLETSVFRVNPTHRCSADKIREQLDSSYACFPVAGSRSAPLEPIPEPTNTPMFMQTIRRVTTGLTTGLHISDHR
jgi:serine/threonine protein kinase